MFRALGIEMSGRLDGIQILRFVAAVLVLVQHAVFIPSLSYGFDVMPFRKLFVGGSGVYLFFVISGYVIGKIVDQPPALFVLHRIARIYPPYLAAMFIAVLTVIATGGVSADAIQWRWSYTLIPLGGQMDSWSRVPFWTLIYEVTFYCISFLLLLGGRKAFDLGLLIWAALIMGASFFLQSAPPEVTTRLLEIIFNPASLLFVSGAALARMHGGNAWPISILAILMLPAFWKTGTPYQRVPMFAVGALGLINIAVVFSPWISKQSWLSLPRKGGDYSYGLYLLHLPAIYVVTVFGLENVMSYTAAVAACLVAGLFAGLLFGYADHAFYNRIARRFADRLFNRYAYCPPDEAAPAALPGK